MNPSPVIDTRGVPAPIRGPDDLPLKEVLVELWQNTEKLVRQEITLASAELDVKTKKLKAEVAAAAVGAGLLLCGALALVTAVIALLALAMPVWLAALLVGVVATGGGFVLIKTNKPNLPELVPQRTIQSLERDVQTFRESTK
jgi:hypothetical protein